MRWRLIVFVGVLGSYLFLFSSFPSNSLTGNRKADNFRAASTAELKGFTFLDQESLTEPIPKYVHPTKVPTPPPKPRPTKPQSVKKEEEQGEGQGDRLQSAVTPPPPLDAAPTSTKERSQFIEPPPASVSTLATKGEQGEQPTTAARNSEGNYFEVPDNVNILLPPEEAKGKEEDTSKSTGKTTEATPPEDQETPPETVTPKSTGKTTEELSEDQETFQAPQIAGSQQSLGECDQPSQFPLDVYEQMKLESPEKLFYLADIISLGYDGTFGGKRYEVEIRPLDEFKCKCHFPINSYAAVCSGYSFFEVLVTGMATPGIWVNYDQKRASYVAEFVLPLPGPYEIKARLVFLDYNNWDGIYHRSTFGWMIKTQKFRVLFPNVTERPVQEGVRSFDSHPDNNPNEGFNRRFYLRQCKGSHFKGYLPGYWNQLLLMWQPYRCLPHPSHPLPKDVAEILNGKWVMFLGDSNTRTLFRTFCDISGNQMVFTNKIFACVGSSFVITEVIFWPTSPEAKNITAYSLQEYVDLAYNKSTPIPDPVLKSKRYPDFYFISPGSHSFDKTGDFLANWILNDWNNTRPEVITNKQIGMLLVTASCGSKIPKTVDLYGMELLQNNLRIKSTNDGVIKLFQNIGPIFDFFSSTHPLTIMQHTADAVHFKSEVYQNHVRLVLAYLYQRWILQVE